MIDIIKSDVTDFAGELATGVSDNAWTRILAFVNQVDLSSVDSDEDRALARIYLAAHLAKQTKSGASAAAGPVTSESAGGIRRSYGFVAMSNSTSLGKTNYGQMYLEILNMCGTGGPVLV